MKTELLQKYLDGIITEYGEDWPDYLPIYYYEQRQLIESWGFDTKDLENGEVGEMFKNLILDTIEGVGYDHSKIILTGLVSTCSVLEWIRLHGCPDLSFTHFEFPEDEVLFGFFKGCPKSLVVSSVAEADVLADIPVEEWHEPVPGIRRIMPCANFNMWYAYINGSYYYITK